MADPLVTWVAEIDAGDGLANLREQMGAVQADFREAEEAAKQAAAAIDKALGSVQYSAPAGPFLADATPQINSIQGPQLPSPELLETWNKIHQAMQRAAGGAEGFQAAIEMERAKILPYDDLAAQLAEVERHYKGGMLSAENGQKIVDQLAKQATARAQEQAAALEKQTREMERQHAQAGKLALVYGLASGALMAWVRAGLSGTAEGERLGLMFGLISREVASIFTPAIHAALRGLENLYAAFRELTGGQQETIRNTAAMVLGFLGIATLVPRLVASVASLGATLQAAMVAQPVLFLVSALGGLLLASEQGRAALGEIARAMEPILQAAAAVARAFAPVAEAVGAILGPIAQVLGTILRFLSPLLDFVAPVLLLTVLFQKLGDTIVNAFTRGTAAVSAMNMSLLANASAATASAAANAAAGAASSASGASSAASGLGGVLGKIGGVVGKIGGAIGKLASGPVGWASLGLGIFSTIKSWFAGKKDDKPAERLSPSSGTFESIESSYQRVQQEVARTDIAQRTRERSLTVLEEIRDGVRRPRDSTPAPVTA